MFWILVILLFLGILYFFHTQIEGFENNALTLEEFNLKYDADIVLLPEGVFALGVENGRYDTFTFVKEEIMIDYWMKYIHPSLPSKYFVLMSPNVFDYRGNLNELWIRPDSLLDGSVFVSNEISHYSRIHSTRKVYAFCKNIRDITTVLLPDHDFIREHAYESQLKEIDQQHIDYPKKINQCIWVETDTDQDFLSDSRSTFKTLYENGNFSRVEVYQNIPISDQIEYKWILDMDEIRSTTICKLYLGSVLLKPMSNWKQWYDLIEWVHYVPIKHDFSDLDEKIEWCLQHEEECKDIVKNARIFVSGSLNWEQVKKDTVETVLDSFRSYG